MAINGNAKIRMFPEKGFSGFGKARQVPIRPFLKCFLLWLFLCAFFAQVIGIRGENIRGTDRQRIGWRLTVLSREGGWPSGRDFVHVCFSTNGNAWIATTRGLMLYDGYSRKEFTVADGLPSNFIRCSLVDRQGRLWVGTDRGAGIFQPSLGRYEAQGAAVGLERASIRRMVEDSEGRLWFCSDAYPQLGPAGLYLCQEGQWRRFGASDGLTEENLHNLAIDGRGRPVALTIDGIFLKNENRWERPAFPLPRESGWSGVILTNGGLAVIGSSGLFLEQNGTWRFDPLPHSGTWPPYYLCSLPDGRVMTFGRIEPRARHSLLEWKNNRFESVSAEIVHQQEWIESVEVAPDESIWAVGGDLVVRAEEDLDGWNEQPGRPTPAFTTGSETWFANERKLLHLQDGRETWESIPDLRLMSDGHGRVWGWNPTNIHVWQSGVRTNYTPAHFEISHLQGMVIDQAGQPWFFGSRSDQTLAVLIPELPSWWLVSIPAQFKGNLAFCPDPKEGVWIAGQALNGTNIPLARLSASDTNSQEVVVETVSHPELVSVPASLPHLFVDSSGAVWMCRKCLLMVRSPGTGQWREVPQESGRSVIWMAENASGLWFVSSGERGGSWDVSRWVNETWVPICQERASRPFKLSDGSLAFGTPHNLWIMENRKEAIPRALPLPVEGLLNGVLVDPEGVWWIGLDDLVFRSTGRQPETRLVPDLVASVVIQGETFRANLQPKVRFASTVPPQRFRVTYALTGAGAAQPFPAPEGVIEISTASLSPGSHEVIARLESYDGRSVLAAQRIPFRVIPIPLQKRAWFWPMLLFLFAIILGLSIVAFAAKRKLARYAQELERRVQDRTIELQQDIQRRELAEASLRSSEERLRTVVSNSPVVLFVLNSEGRFLLSEGQALTPLGLRPGQVVGMSVFDVYRDYPPLLQSVRQALAGEAFTVEIEVGDLVYETAYAPLRHPDGRLNGTIGVATNVTERRRMEEQKIQLEAQLRQAQKMEAIGLLAGGVAHDFNNLLQIIQGNTQLALQSGTPWEEVEEYLKETMAAVERASSLTRQLLAFGKRQMLQRRDLDLGKLVQAMLDLIQRLIGPANRIEFVRDPSLGNLHADKVQVEQILLNLCLNARDAMPQGGLLSVEVRNQEFSSQDCLTHPWARPGTFVRMSISDTGSGMNPSVMEHLFEPFFTTKPKGKGTGLGLSVVYGIVQQHEGMIRVNSQPGQGTRFDVYFPVVPAREIAVKSESSLPAGGGNETILLVDDEPTVLAIARRVLERAGYCVLTGLDGCEGVTLFQQHHSEIRLVILDAMMPRMDGRQACQRIRELAPHIPVLFASGYNAESLQKEQTLPPGTQWLEKPYQPKDLLNRVRQLLQEGGAP